VAAVPGACRKGPRWKEVRNLWMCTKGSTNSSSVTTHQGLTLVHFSAQLERFPWDRGCAQGLFEGE